jgi:UDP-N-acetyl-D-glucosamine dehydrogenase
MSSTKIEQQNLAAIDAVIIVTNHSAYDFTEIVKYANLVIDTRSATRGIDADCEKIVME